MPRTPTPPFFRRLAFQCPHSDCGMEAQQSWAVLNATDSDTGDSLQAGMEMSTCHVCGNFALWRVEVAIARGGYQQGTMVFPTVTHSGPPPNSDMPDTVKALYEEARSVVTLSARSASALLRLSLEVLLEHLYPEKDRLNDRIGEARRNGVPEVVVRAMDVLRSKGNDSVHKIEADEGADAAESLFRIVNLVVERLISEPREIDELHSALPEGVRDQIDRRDASAEA